MNDIALSFDPTGFLSGIKAIENQLVSLNSNFKKTGDVGTKKNQKVQLSAMNLMGVFAKLGVVVGGFKMALSGIPEIGRTFKIAGDIFQRNFLWPLRKELIPILQSLLNWVRENRAMFVRWGTVVANIFRTIFSIVKSLVKMVRGVFNTLFSELEKIFGKATSSVTEMANVILFKITAIAMFIMMTLEPVFSWLAKQFMYVLKAITSFFSGFIEGFGSISAPIADFMQSIQRLGGLIDRINKSVYGMTEVFKTLGRIIGGAVKGAITILLSMLDGIVSGIQAVMDIVDLARAKSPEEKAIIQKRMNKNRMDEAKRAIARRREMGIAKKSQSEIDAEVAELIGFKPKGQITSNNSTATSIVNDHKVVTINVNGAKDPISISREIKTTLESQLRESRFRTGGR